MSRCAWIAVLCGCSSTNRVSLCPTTDAGAPLRTASAAVEGEVYEADRDGVIALRLSGPVVARLSAPGHLDEPVAIDPHADTCIPVALVDDAEGSRVAIHFGGDFMLGRRYAKTEEGTPLLDPGDVDGSAREVVSELARSFLVSDWRVVNLETVVGLHDADLAYPGKRWLLQTEPEALAALDELGVGAVVLANNHQRDWLEPGVQSTVEALEGWGFDRVGGGLDAAEAAQPLVAQVGDLTVGQLAWTSVEGSFVNDTYPDEDAVEPADLSPEDAWLWERRTWRAEAFGIEEAERRIGGAWRAIEQAEVDLDEADAAVLWDDATGTYPELQDWVARRGHGGANPWLGEPSLAAVEALRPDVDLLVAQLHMGMQFADAPTEYQRETAYDLIDAGADLVIAHHPHVLQGLEWYHGKLIVWSLGNFVFDQDFLVTFPSGFLRTIWEDDGTLVQARFVPLELDAYRPVAVVGERAQAVLNNVVGSSSVQAIAERAPDLSVYPIKTEIRGEIPGFALEHGTLRITSEAAYSSEAVELGPGERLRLEGPGVVQVAGDLRIGRELFAYGDFEDLDTDDDVDEAVHWYWGHEDVTLTSRRPWRGGQSLQLVRYAGSTSRITARPVARVPLPAHRLYDSADASAGLDGEATFTLHAAVWASGEAEPPKFRVTLYHFTDVDPTRFPETTVLHDFDLPIELDRLGDWQEVWVDLPAHRLEPVDGLVPNTALIYVVLDPPENRTTVARFDDVGIVEWRDASTPDGAFVQGDLLYNPSLTRTVATLEIRR